MTIEILDTEISKDFFGNDSGRTATISITSGGQSYLLYVGGLPLTGELLPGLEAREAELWQAASAGGQAFDVFELVERRVIKALALVVLDEINILRAKHADLAPRSEGQIRGAIKTKLVG